MPSIEDIVAAQRRDKSAVGPGFYVSSGVIYYHGGVYVPAGLRFDVIAACHSLCPFRHPGVKKTRSIVRRRFCWPGFDADVRRFIKSCLYCARVRAGPARLQGLFHAFPTDAFLCRVHLDHWTVQYGGEHFQVLTMIDSASRWAEAAVVESKSAQATADAFLHTWVCRFGVPAVIVTDNGKAFIGEVFERLASALGCRHIRSAVHHPEGNAAVESLHRDLARYLRHMTPESTPFADALPLALMAHRCTVHGTTGESPFYLTFGCDPATAQDNDWRALPPGNHAERIKWLSILRLEVQLRAQLERHKQLAKTNLKDRVDRVFIEGELVLLMLTPAATMLYKTAAYKTCPRWGLPHRVVSVSKGGKTATVRCLLTCKLRDVHIQNVQFILEPVDAFQEQEWLALAKEHLTAYDEATRSRILRNYFEEIRRPQKRLLPPPDRVSKARRLGGGV